MSEAQTCAAFLRSINSSVWIQCCYLEGKGKVIKDEPEKVNWERIIKVITSSLGKETWRSLNKATVQLNDQSYVFELKI